MISCYITGILPRPKELIRVTRSYVRGRIEEQELEEAFKEATSRAVKTQLAGGFSYVTDGMLEWQDMLRPFTTALDGVRTGSLARWFNNNTFYRRPMIVGEIQRNKRIVEDTTYIQHLPSSTPWKAILPAPYTFAHLSQNEYYRSKIELMFKYAEILREEITGLAKLGFKYVQLSDPALVYQPNSNPIGKDELNHIGEALEAAVKGIQVKTCLQTFFGDFSQILPEAIDFPVDHLGIDFYETDFGKMGEWSVRKGVALGLIDSRNSLIEKPAELITVAEEIIGYIDHSASKEVFICPNCDLDFLTWERAEEKMRVLGIVANLLRDELS
jgi:5-methyltetrahydropteroyltriglutamate--homocysteine methyltransferase